MKCKVGDRVKTIHGTGKVISIDDSLLLLLVKYDTWDGGHNGNVICEGSRKLQGSQCCWLFESGLIKLHNQKVIITTDGINVTARLKEDGNELNKTIAKCNPQDTFDFETGAKLAFERLFEKEVKEPKPYNAKIVCVKVVGRFTKGKIYEVKDGFLFDDIGLKFEKRSVNSKGYKNIEEINNNLVSQFIEVVE